MRFLDLAPDAMRMPSLPGQDILSDRGENLSSVLQSICESPQMKQAILSWIQELTPLDVVDFEFRARPDRQDPGDPGGVRTGRRHRPIAPRTEPSGSWRCSRRCWAPSPRSSTSSRSWKTASIPRDCICSCNSSSTRFPGGAIQVVATSHSPQLLGFLSEKSRADAALFTAWRTSPTPGFSGLWRFPRPSACSAKQNLARLHALGMVGKRRRILGRRAMPVKVLDHSGGFPQGPVHPEAYC